MDQQPVVIFDDDQIQVLHLAGQGDTLVLAFSPMGTYANGVSFWGQAPCQKLDYPALGFVAKHANWFPAKSIKQSLSACSGILGRYSKRIAIGQSMGGYAALKYGKLLGIKTSVAFAPQATIEPAMLPAATNRFSQFYSADFHDGMIIAEGDLPDIAYCIFDPKEAFDLDAYSRIRAVAPHIQRVDVLNVGHEVIRSFASTESFRLAFSFAQRDDQRGFQEFAQKVRRLPGQRSTGICIASIYRRTMLAFTLFKRDHVHMILRDVKGISFALGQHFLKHNSPGKALELFQIGLARMPGDTELKAAAANAKAICLERASK